MGFWGEFGHNLDFIGQGDSWAAMACQESVVEAPAMAEAQAGGSKGQAGDEDWSSGWGRRGFACSRLQDSERSFAEFRDVFDGQPIHDAVRGCPPYRREQNAEPPIDQLLDQRERSDLIAFGGVS